MPRPTAFARSPLFLALSLISFLQFTTPLGTLAQSPGPGAAQGQFTVDGKAIAFAHAYAQVEVGGDGADQLWVLLTERPLPTGMLPARFREIAASEQINALAFTFDAGNQASDWRWHHPLLSIGCGFCSDLRFTLQSRTRDRIAGTVASAKVQTFQKHKYEFRITFNASITQPAAGGATTTTQKAALRKLQQNGASLKPESFIAYSSQPDMVRLFLDAGMKPDALSRGMEETVLFYVSRTDCTDDRRPEAQAEALKVIPMLIAAGANPNWRGPNGNVPLTAAYRCAAIADALLTSGAQLSGSSPDASQTAGQYVMDAAIGFQRADMVKVLIAHGYDVKRDGARLLEQARGKAAIEALLRKAGATTGGAQGRSPSSESSRPAPTTAAGAAVAARTPEQAKKELSRRKLAFTDDGFWEQLTDANADAVALYLDAGMSASARREPPQGDTPLLFATSGGCGAFDAARRAASERIVLALIAHKADVNAKDGNGTSPLTNAAGGCPVSVVKALLAAGADLKAKSAGGATPMMMAVMGGHTDNVRALIDAGYDVGPERATLAPLTTDAEIKALLKQGAATKKR